MTLQRISIRRVNPYNEIGIIHNNALDYFVKHAPADYKMDDILRLSAISVLGDFKSGSKCMIEDQLLLQGVAANAFNTMYLVDQPSSENFIPINVEAIIETGGFDNVQGDLIQRLLNPCTDLTLEQFMAIVVTVECEILSGSMPRDKQFPLLVATAVAKSTIPYWINSISDPNSPWGPFVAQRKWWKFVLADLGGALGGVEGGLIGAGVGAAFATISYALD